MTKITVNGVTTTNTPEQEQYEFFTDRIGGKTKRYCQYDYRHTDGKLFSCVKPSLDACRQARDEWVADKNRKADISTGNRAKKHVER